MLPALGSAWRAAGLAVVLAMAFTLWGQTEGTARAVPALAALVAVGATAGLGAHLLGPTAGILAGMTLGFGATTLPSAGEAFWPSDRLRAAWAGGPRVWLVSGRSPELSVVGHLPSMQPVAISAGRWLYVNR